MGCNQLVVESLAHPCGDGYPFKAAFMNAGARQLSLIVIGTKQTHVIESGLKKFQPSTQTLDCVH